MRRLLASIVLVLATTTAGLSATVQPSDDVTDHVTVRAQASSQSAEVGRLNVGQEAEYLGKKGAWRKVKLANGKTGFVSKRWTKLVGEDAGGGGVPAWDTFAGLPKSTKVSSEFEVLVNKHYTVGYSETRRDPLWVAYHLFPVGDTTDDPRPSTFTTDTRTTAQVGHHCYDHLDYDRGHNAANHALDSRYGLEGQKESFLMSNVCPQFACLNEQTWEAFEKVESEDYAQHFDSIWTVTGPIFDDSPDKIACQVQIPKAFYKIVVRVDNGKPVMLPIIMSQDIRGRHHLNEFVTTVDAIEQATGLDFFSDLPDDVENAAEAAQPDDSWNLDQELVPHFPCRVH